MAVYFLNTHQETIGMVSFEDAIEVFQEQEITDDSSLLNDVATVTIKNNEKLAKAAYFAIRAYGENKQTFDVYEVHSVKTDKTTTFTGVQLAARELEGYVVEDIRPENRSVEYVANQILAGTDWQIGYVESGLPIVTSTFYYLSVKDALKQLQSFGCEFKFKVEISGNQITDKFVEIYSQMGDRTGQRFTYGHNALTIVREISNANIYTALIGRGKGEESESGDGYGRKLNFEDVEWSKSKGDPVDKPLGQKYVELPEATEIYGIQTFDGKRPRIGIVEFNDEEDKSILLRSTYQALLDTSRPLVQFKSTVAAMGNLKIGDTVTVHRYDLGIHYETRIFKVIRNRKNNKATELSLGDKVSLSSTERQRKLNSTVSELNKAQNDIKTDVSYVITNAVGNRITYGNTEPDRKRVGDMWYRDHPSLTGEKQMLIWNGEGWDITLDTSIENSVAEEVAAIQEEMDANKTATEQAINQAITDANAYAEQQTSALKTEVEASNEILDAAIATAQNRADAAFADAEIAKNNAFAATQTAQTAINDSVTAINNAQTALDSLTAISGDLSELDQSVQTKFTNIDGQLSNMVTQTTFDTLNQKVTSQGTLISQTQTALLSKADKTVVDTINQTVGQHTTKIEQNAQAITARLTETQINNLLGTKNYVNQTTLTATANGLNASITQVSTDIKGLLSSWVSSYRVNTTNGLPLTKSDGSPLVDNESYEIQAITTSTSTVTTAIVVFKSKGIGKGWEIIKISELGSNSNHPELFIDDTGRPSIRLYGHSSLYPVQVTHTSYSGKDTPLTNAQTQFTTIEATIQGLQTTVGNKAEQSQVTQLAGQISSKVESSTYNSKMTQLDNAIQSKVDSATYSSKMTQLDNAISLRVTQKQVTDAILADKTIIDTRSDNQLPSWYFTNYPRQTVEEFKYRNIMGVPGSAQFGQLTTKVQWSNTSGGVITQIFSSSDGVFQRQGNAAATGWGAWDKIAETGKLISEINISTEGILIAGKRIRLDGDVTMEQAFISRLNTLTLNAVTANITTIRSQVLQANVVTSTHLQTSTATIDKLFATDAMVSRLTAKTAFINSVKAIDISADRITTGTLNAANVAIINLSVDRLTGNRSNFVQSAWNSINSSVSLDGNKMQFTGKYTSNWDGTSRVRDIDTILENGMLRIRNVPDHQTLYFSNNGISTMIDGSGLVESEEPIASGTIQFFDLRYGTTRGITMQSHTGDVALRTTAAFQDIILDSARDVLLLNPSGVLEVYGNIKSGGITHRADSYNLYLGAQEEVRITNRDYYNGGRTSYQRMRASIGYFNGVEANVYNDANFFYIGAPDEVRVVASFDNKGTYKPIRASDIHVNSVIANTINDATNLYLGASNEVRVVNTLGWNNGNPQYNRIRSSAMFSTGLYTNEAHGGYNLYLGAVGEVRVVANIDNTGSYKPIRATNFYQSSSRDYKENIETFGQSALSILNELTVVEYNLKDDLKNGVNKREVGFIAEDSASIATSDLKAIDSYKTSALAVKAIQELSEKVNRLENEIVILKRKMYH